MLGLLHCGREAAPPGAVHPLPRPALEPWRWHFVGDLLVVEGELEQPTQLTLKTRTSSETCRLPLGPVRWELYRPPRGELAELRSGDGTLLATWDFDLPPASAEAKPPAAPPAPVKPPPAPVKPPPPPVKPPPPPVPAPVKPPPPPGGKSDGCALVFPFGASGRREGVFRSASRG